MVRIVDTRAEHIDDILADLEAGFAAVRGK